MCPSLAKIHYCVLGIIFTCLLIRCLCGSPVQGLHFALWGEGKVRFTWLNPLPYRPGWFQPRCKYGQSSSAMNSSTPGTAYSYTDGMFNGTLNSVTVDLHGLSGGIFYSCGDNNYGWSDAHSFQLQGPSAYQRQLSSIALIADLGVTNGSDTIQALSEFSLSGLVQMVVHAGDISYADDFNKHTGNNSYIWTNYMREIEKFSFNVPYMTAPGNHERQFDFAAYRNWLPMPSVTSGSLSPFWFSFDYMGIHFLSLSTEHNFNQSSEQYNFLKQDLMKANKNRDNVPWIMVYGHRPLYCSSLVAEHRCVYDAPVYRRYLEDLLYDQSVDVYLSGHDHSYERSYPVYKGKVTQRSYHNAKAPVYIVDGEAGSPEPNDPSFLPYVEWRAHCYPSWDNGFLLVQPTPSTLRFQYIRSKDRSPVDVFSITKY